MYPHTTDRSTAMPASVALEIPGPAFWDLVGMLTDLHQVLLAADTSASVGPPAATPAWLREAAAVVAVLDILGGHGRGVVASDMCWTAAGAPVWILTDALGPRWHCRGCHHVRGFTSLNTAADDARVHAATCQIPYTPAEPYRRLDPADHRMLAAITCTAVPADTGISAGGHGAASTAPRPARRSP